jgi:hypothetical protein
VRAIHEDFRLDDRHQLLLLAERRVASERMHVRGDAALRRKHVADFDHGAPLRESRTEASVLGEALAQVVEALGDVLTLVTRERLRAVVDLDARDDAKARAQRRYRFARGALLPDRFVLENDARNELFDARRREHQLAKIAAARFGRRDLVCVVAFRQRLRSFVGSEDAFAGRHE